jgi:hypothetical protein
MRDRAVAVVARHLGGGGWCEETRSGPTSPTILEAYAHRRVPLAESAHLRLQSWPEARPARTSDADADARASVARPQPTRSACAEERSTSGTPDLAAPRDLAG